MEVINFIKDHTPRQIRLVSRRMKNYLAQVSDERLDLKSLFTRIYQEHSWAENGAIVDPRRPFNSGPGSKGEAAERYIDCINHFIAAQYIRSVVDLGCGDFRIGSRIARPEISYVGVDIVEPLIQANQAQFGTGRVRFQCIDITRDELPAAELCLIREVLQHLSNAEAMAILTKTRKYKRVIVTERWPGPQGSFKANRDKPHGRAARFIWNSGLVLTEPPFNLKNVELFLDIRLPQAEFEGDTHMVSFLITN